MAQYSQSTTYSRMFKMIDSSDHLSAKTGLSCSVNISKNGGSFSSAAGSVSEVSNGWYKIDLTTADTNTIGDLAFYITASGADDTDFVDQVIDPIRGVGSPTALPNAAAGASSGLIINGSNSGAVTLAALTCTGTLTISDGVVVSRSTGNSTAISITGSGTGHGISVSSGSGSTGNGINCISSSTNGHGVVFSGTGTGNGIRVTSISGDAILTSVNTSGHGVTFQGTGTTKHGINAIGGTVSSSGIRAAGGGTGHGLSLVSGTTGVGLDISAGTSNDSHGINITSTGHGINITGTNNTQPRHGLNIVGHNASGSVAAGSGVVITGGTASTTGGGDAGRALVLTGGSGAASTNGAGSAIIISGGGTTTVSGNTGLTISGTSNANAITISSPGTGRGLSVTSSSGVGIYVQGGTNSSGLLIESLGNASAVNFAAGTNGAGLLLEGGSSSGAAIDASTGHITGNLIGSINGLTATALADLFDTDSGTTYASAVAGSVVKEIVDNVAGDPPPTVNEIADAVWDEDLSGHVTVGSAGEAAGRIDDTITSRASQSSVDTIDSNVDSILDDTSSTGVVVATGSKTGYSLSSTQTFDLTGNITGNLSGSVGSVTGNVGGNIIGSVDSVTDPVSVGTIQNTASNIKKNEALANFAFLMTDSLLHTPATGLTITATRSIDGASFVACANAVTELNNGWYKINLAAGDLNGNVIALRFTASGADDRNLTIITQP